MRWFKSSHPSHEPLAQLVEHLTFNQGVTGSSPVWLTIITKHAGVAELADALDLGSSAFGVGVRLPSPAPFFALKNIIIYRGSSSVVEHHLAKVGVAGSNPVFRSIILPGWRNWQTHRT